MKSAFSSEQALYDLLKNSQTPGNYPWQISPSIDLYDWQPGDFTIEGKFPADGVYIYFDSTNFAQEHRSAQSQTHYPIVHIDVYSSAKAKKDGSEITQSYQVASDNNKDVCIEIYQAVTDTQFLRLLTEKIQELSGLNFRPSQYTGFLSCEKFGVTKPKDASLCTAMTRYVYQIDVNEIHLTNPGVPLDGRDDTIISYSKGQWNDEIKDAINGQVLLYLDSLILTSDAQMLYTSDDEFILKEF